MRKALDLSRARDFASLALLPDRFISPNIRLIRLLATGAMGGVWLAEHVGLKVLVAVKFMSPDLVTDAACLARFEREAKLAARIKSPHVVEVFDFATTEEGLPFLVMELLEGEDLETRLSQNGPLSLDETSRVVLQVLRALACAHALGVVHRDIKPENLFLIGRGADTFVKVLDFGIAKDDRRFVPSSSAGTTGTPVYMSTEQLFEPDAIDQRSDLWSTAVVAYECLTGKLPFDGTSFGSFCVAVDAARFTPPSALLPHLPRHMDAWFARGLCRDKECRFASAAEMANAYLAALEQAGILPLVLASLAMF